MRTVKKSLGQAKEGEKIYRVCIRQSQIIENADGSIIKDMTIDKIESLGDFYNNMFTLSDGERIRAYINNEVAVVERVPDEKSQHPLAIYEDFYCQNRRVLLQTVSDILEDNIQRMEKLREEALKISNRGIVSKNIADSLYDMFAATGEDENENVLSELEFAEMAL